MSDDLAGQSISSPWFAGAGQITQGWRPGPGAYEPDHTGIDVALPVGTPIVAAWSGNLEERVDPSGFGNYEILHPDNASGVAIVLGHLAEYLVGPGHVSAGQAVGLSGSTGWSTGPHLHFQENIGAPASGYGGRDVNPYPALTAGAPAAVGGTPDLGQLPGDIWRATIPGQVVSWLGGPGSTGAGSAGSDPFGIAAAGRAVGTGIAGGITAAVDGTAQHISNAVNGELNAARGFVSKQLVALLVATVVVLVLFL